MRATARSLIRTGPSTLLLPPRQAKALDRLLRGTTMNSLLKNLESRGVPTNLRRGALRIRYQGNRQGLVRRDFRVDAALWFHLGQMARMHGVSRCLLFTALLAEFLGKTSEFRQRVVGRFWRLMEMFDFSLYSRSSSLRRIPHGRMSMIPLRE